MNVMNHMKKIRTALAALLCLLAAAAASAKDPMRQHTLPNGLSLFIAENHSVPLVYIEVAVRCGAFTQEPETAGLFHLYEHMMFKGNALYEDAAAVQRALSDMGVASWNGSTGLECVNYYFTVPSDQLEKGLAFWNSAIRFPLLDAAELEAEKKVVIAEIQGNQSDPGRVFSSARDLLLFPDAPWKMDPAGSVEAVAGATAEALLEIQRKYYTPDNAAVFVGGDIDPEEARRLVSELFGSWEDGAERSKSGGGFRHAAAPLKRPELRVMPSAQVSPQLAHIRVDYRGPDAEYERNDTYAADMLVGILNDPDGTFKRTFAEDPLLLPPGSDYIWSGYATRRQCGVLSFGTAVLNPAQDLPERALYFSEKLPSLLSAIASSESQEAMAAVCRRISDDKTYAGETAQGLLNELRFWWVCADADYSRTYLENMADVSSEQLSDFVRRYVAGTQAAAPELPLPRKKAARPDAPQPLVTVLVNPAVYESSRAAFEAAGFSEITKEDAFWWKRSPEQPAPSSGEERLPEPDEWISPELALYRLSNGIPVYVRTGLDTAVADTHIVVSGGVRCLSPETSGLEDALFTMMTMGSERFSYPELQSYTYRTQGGISSSSSRAGSVIGTACIASYFDGTLERLLDGFLHPAFGKSEYELLMKKYEQDIQQMQNDPDSLLLYCAEQSIYEGHPYAAAVSVTPDSIGQITVDAMRRLHAEILDARRISVVAAGRLDVPALLETLEAALGTIPNGTIPLPSGAIPEVRPSGAPLVRTSPAADGTGYAMRAFASPPVFDDDYVPACIAADIFSDILFAVVREKYGACYTPGSMVFSSAAPFGIEYLNRISNLTDFAAYMEEARGIMASGSTIRGRVREIHGGNPEELAEGSDSGAGFELEPISDRLPGYINSYINRKYASQASTSGVALRICTSLLQFGDALSADALCERAREATADDIARVFQKYWIDGGSRWFAVVGEEDADIVSF
ncbi:MAG: insulinase family protein [Treponemataceae bacterium]|nr:insulinase family protein [Treponemataceae bacterium]